VKRLFLTILLLCGSAFGSDYYFSQTAAGSGNGSSCSNAIAFGNGTSTGLSSSTYQAAGNNLHLCAGTFTFASNAQLMNTTVSGTGPTSSWPSLGGGTVPCSSPITLIADQGAVVLQAPYFSPFGAIEINNICWVLNGDSNLTIENTENGTPASYDGGATCLAGTCMLQQNSRFVYINTCTSSTCNLRVTGMSLLNNYVHLPLSGDVTQGVGENECVYYVGFSNVMVDNNHCSGVSIGLDGWGNNIDLHSNEVYDCNTCVAYGSSAVTSNFLFYANHIHDNYVWDESSDDYHHDGLHFYPINGGANVQGFIAYNNQFDGDFGSCCQSANFVLEATMTSPVLFNNVCLSQGGDYGMPCFDSFQNGTGGASPNTIATPTYYNNSMYGITVSATVGDNSIEAIDSYTTNLSMENNVANGGQNVVGISTGSTLASGGIDYNLWENTISDSGATNIFSYHGTYCTTLACWQSATGQDAHAVLSTFSAMGLSTSMVPTSSSALTVGTGTNLYTYFGCSSPVVPGLGAGCHDKPVTVGPGYPTVGPNLRASSTSSPWDKGAYNYSGGPPLPPTGLTATVSP
jgi:hypothetical protein